VWLSLWRRLRGEQDLDHPASYVYTVARREAIRAVKRELARLREGEGADDPPPPSGDDPHEQAVASETGERIRAALERIAPDRRKAVQARLNGLDVDEIMDLFGWPYEKARNLIARGMADLRSMLGEER
jgi:RNA polymerase sigma factor (sigma-70 family)